MSKLQTVLVVFATVSIGHAATTNISGVVMDRSGEPISDALVKLETINDSAITATDGSFTLTETSAMYQPKNSPLSAAGPVCFQNGELEAKSLVAIRDVIIVIKEGWINYRDSIRTSDTSGIVIQMIPNAGDVTDADGNVYQSVKIGKQIWTVENLRTTKYNDGTAIPHVTDPAVWIKFTDTGGVSKLTTPVYCFYNNTTSTTEREKWGALYNWYAVKTGKLAPAGWHVPTNADWTDLENYLIDNGYNYNETTSGNKIGKSLAAKTDWRHARDTGNVGLVGNGVSGDNRTGLSFLPGGWRDWEGNFDFQGGDGYWWSSTEYDTTDAWIRWLQRNYECLFKTPKYKQAGLSVRLLRD